jgi:uncharacterized protein (TIGR02246 family)
MPDRHPFDLIPEAQQVGNRSSTVEPCVRRSQSHCAKEAAMQRFKYLLVLGLLIGTCSGTKAGPAEKIAQLMQQLDQTFNEGNLDAYMAPYADNTVFSPPNVPFRIEGKDALRAYYAGTLQAFPRRRVDARQPSIQVYDGKTAVVSRYNRATFVDKSNNVTNFYLRQTYTWVKLGERWTLVEQHYSTLPILP